MCDLWKHDQELKEALEKYVKEGFKRTEIVDFLCRDFSCYCWSIRTLDRRLRHFKIYYTDTGVDQALVAEAVLKEMDGPGQLLGYRAMYNKIRQVHNLKVARNLVHEVMKATDPEGMEARAPLHKRKKKGHFTSPGTNFVHSLDGHDKLMGYQNSTFPIAIYGCLDTCSRKLLWVKVWISNSDPRLIGRFYLEYLYESKKMARYLRLDKGTETGIMAAMHAYLRQKHDDEDAMDTVIYGPSTSNQIERWWKELHERLEKFFKLQLSYLKDQRLYDPHNDLHRSILAFIMVPVMQTNIDEFVNTVWNTHRIRQQRDSRLPSGIPDHIYSFPESYGLNELGVAVDSDLLEEAATASGVLLVEKDYLTSRVRQACERIIPEPEKIHPAECVEAFIHLLRNVEHMESD